MCFELLRLKKKKLFVTFVDFEKAFDGRMVYGVNYS
jgi:hypothetical protein